MTSPATPTRFPHGRRTWAAVLIGSLILIIAAATGYLAVLKALGRNISGLNLHSVVQHLSGTSWNARELLIIGIVTAAIGLALLLVTVLPGDRSLVRLTNPDGCTAAALSRRSLQRTVQSAALHIDGISGARARIGSRRIRMDLSTGLRHTEGLSDSAIRAASLRLAALDLERPRPVAARLHPKED